MFQQTKNDPRSRVFRVGDSPSTGFINKQDGEALTQIRGKTEFRTAVVSFSKQAINSVVANADAVWRVDYGGDVSVSNSIGEWSKTSAQVINVQGWKPIFGGS